MDGELEVDESAYYRRESDRLLGALVTRLKAIEEWQAQHSLDQQELRKEVERLRDAKNQSTGALLAVGTLAPVVGAIIYWLAERAFDLNGACH
jgi:hypothetical protein